MSDLSSTLNTALDYLPTQQTQLPVTSYFDDALFRREQELIFQHGPRYLGHALAVPQAGDYYALPQEGEGRAIVRTPQGLELISNVCRPPAGLDAARKRPGGPVTQQHRLPLAPLDL